MIAASFGRMRPELATIMLRMIGPTPGKRVAE